MRLKHCESSQITIYMAGDIHQAKQACREFCFDTGFCVTVTATTYIYTGGEEAGFTIGIINYPRFPDSTPNLLGRARELADLLRSRLCQHSYTIVGPDQTEWSSSRKAAQ